MKLKTFFVIFKTLVCKTCIKPRSGPLMKSIEPLALEVTKAKKVRYGS